MASCLERYSGLWPAEYDAIVYGYAFNNHWMWYNGISLPDSGTSKTASLMVWKDYNCQNWKVIGRDETGSSTFSMNQKIAIENEVIKIT